MWVTSSSTWQQSWHYLVWGRSWCTSLSAVQSLSLVASHTKILTSNGANDFNILAAPGENFLPEKRSRYVSQAEYVPTEVRRHEKESGSVIDSYQVLSRSHSSMNSAMAGMEGTPRISSSKA